ncbi:MAG: hypothetical protein KJ072_26975, partial [Verrucomicrobia bacterium]|nr:hypothetical protein [Verrucomicrobiota bacterium]
MKALAYILGMAIAVLASNASELPSWSPRSSAEGCGGCGSGTGDLLDTATLLYVDMGPGAEISNLGGIALRASESSPNLGSPAALELNGFAFWGAVQTSEMDIRRDAFGRLRQLATARLFIDIATNSPYRFTIRVMDQAAKGTLANGFYSYSTNVSYLLKEYRVENPDASPVTYHRLKITETWPSTREWLCTYTATNSGWNVALPGSIGSVDLVTTNHAATAYTVIKRHRNLSGQIAAQRTQIYTNYAWGSALLSDFEGVGSEARTRRWTYYESGFAFTPTPFKPPLKTVENADGSWRMIQSYDG